MGNSANMRISLPPGTEVTGRKGKYVVANIISLSERTTTVSCKSENGKTYRLKFFNGQNSVDIDSVKQLLSISTKGIVASWDIGTYSDMLFCVYENYSLKSTNQQTFSVHILTKVIIPQIAYVINQFHYNRVLLRDITPEHILYDTSRSEILYFGFSNITLLKGKASSTKEPGYGQHFSYVAPEVETWGYSIASDYFSLGVTLLTLIKGKNVFLDITKDEFYNVLNSGRVPGINIEHLQNTPYEMYSAEDRLLYLILGLLIPNPNQRWRYGEIRCWCNNQHIPIIQRGERVEYQYTQSFEIDGTSCWNDKYLSEYLAKSKKAWNRKLFNKLFSFLKSQNSKKIDLSELDKCSSDKAKIFKTIYMLNPSINGFWWNGICYDDTSKFVELIEKNHLLIKDLQEILANNCFSFYAKCREKIGATIPVNIRELKQFEELEKNNPGMGANRCLIILNSNKQGRTFQVEGKDFNSISSLISAYAGLETKLKGISRKIIEDDSFQAWLWAKGMEGIGKEAKKVVNDYPQNSFILFLSICERCAENDATIKKIREIFLKFGDLAPIVWLTCNIKYYKVASPVNQTLYDTFKNTKFDLNNNIVSLNDKLNSLVIDYQLFVQRTLDNPFVLENKVYDGDNYGYYPVYECGYFCCKWNNTLEVCPAFLKSVNSRINPDEILNWIRKCANAEKEHLEFVENQIMVSDLSESGSYLGKCGKNIASSIVMIIIASVLLIISFNYSVGFGLLSFGLAIIFPVLSLNWYYQKKVRAEVWYRSNSQQADQKSMVHSMKIGISTRENEIYQGIVGGSNNKCKIINKSLLVNNMVLDDPDKLDLSTGKKCLAYVSTYGYVMLTTVILGYIYSSFTTASLYAVIYGIGAPYLLRRKQFINSCFEWTVTTCIVTGASIFGCLAFGNTFLTTMNWIPVVCILVIIGFMIILSL